MSYYAIAQYAVEDLERFFQEYVSGGVEIIFKHGGEVLAATDATPIEATPPAPRVVILKFPSEEAFRGFYDDPDYQPFKKIRHSMTTGSSMVGVPSFEG